MVRVDEYIYDLMKKILDSYNIIDNLGESKDDLFTLDLELIWAQEHMIDNYYMGPGYEKSSEYKANYRGFQWWTGSEWSTNKRQYRRLCKRDSKLTEFSSLGNFSLIPNKN